MAWEPPGPYVWKQSDAEFALFLADLDPITVGEERRQRQAFLGPRPELRQNRTPHPHPHPARRTP